MHGIERVAGRKARGPQAEEIDSKCQTFFFFLSLLRGRRKQTTSVRYSPPSVYKIERSLFKILRCHNYTWFHLNFSQALS